MYIGLLQPWTAGAFSQPESPVIPQSTTVHTPFVLLLARAMEEVNRGEMAPPNGRKEEEKSGPTGVDTSRTGTFLAALAPGGGASDLTTWLLPLIFQDALSREGNVTGGKVTGKQLSRACLGDGMEPSAASGEQSPPSMEEMFNQVAARFGLEPALLKAVARVESGFNPYALSPAGAQGLMQLMPATAAAMGVRDPWDVRQNLEGGARYLRSLLDRYHGNVTLALAAYNAGPGAVERYGGVPPYRETRQYIQRVDSARREFSAVV
ncbi:lytic transglycosylase domain-containing protein [Desulfofundulus thermobenzoicus]|nr:lytic transglycosylase domain-containing protein [Desulfofundulus thermobenzoicus]